MNRALVFVSALGAGLLSLVIPTTLTAQAVSLVPAPAQAIPSKVAIIAFDSGVFGTSDGQKAVQNVQQKYKPRKAQIDALTSEVASLKKQLQSTPPPITDEERASRLKNIDIKEKQLKRDTEQVQAAYNADLQEAYGKLSQKFSVTMRKYAQDNGFTLVLNVSTQHSPILWAQPQEDITTAVIHAYNAASGSSAASAITLASNPNSGGDPNQTAQAQKRFGSCYVFASWLTPQEGFVSRPAEWPEGASQDTLQRPFWNWFKENYPQKAGNPPPSFQQRWDEQAIKMVVCKYGSEAYVRDDVQGSIDRLGAILVNWIPD